MKLTRCFLLAIILLAAVFSFTGFAHAVAKEGPTCPCGEEGCAAGKHLFLELSTGFYNNYLCLTSGVLAYSRPVFQGYGKLIYMRPNFQVYAKVWGSKIIVPDTGKFGGDELDPIIVGVAFPLWKFKMDIGYGYYDLHPQFQGSGDLHGIFGTISFPNKWVEPYLTVEFDIGTNKKTLEGGWYYRAGLSKCHKLRPDLTLVADVSLGGNDGAFGTRPDFFSYLRGTVGFDWQPLKRHPDFSLVATGGYQKKIGRHTSHGGLTRDAVIGSLEAKWKFDLLGHRH